MHASVDTWNRQVAGAMPCSPRETPSGTTPEVRRIMNAFRWHDETMLATCHMPRDGAFSKQIGVLLVNAGPAPRAGNSDVSVRIADRVAQSGMMTIRFDLPGLGDSSGTSYERIEDFRLAAQIDPLDDILVSVADEAHARHGIDRFVVGGLCAGSVIAVRGARRLGAMCAGMVLLEPDMLDARTVSDRRRFGLRTAIDRVIRGFERRSWSAASARVLRRLHDLVERGRMPADVSQDVVDAWIGLSERGLPTLLVLAEGLSCDLLCDRIIAASGGVLEPDVRSGAEAFDDGRVRPASVHRVRIRDTNHLLTAGDGPERVPAETVSWVLRLAGSRGR